MVMSILWVGLLVFFMIEWAMKAGSLIGISSAVMGLTFCAAGTSIPDCMCSLIVARNRKGIMAISNIFGSNIFDILIALGVPWALKLTILQQEVVVDHPGFMISIGILVFILLAYASCVAIMRFKLP